METFKEQLERLDGNTLVYVGTDIGSAWLVIETAETLLEKMDLLNDKVREITIDRMEFLIENLRWIPERIQRIKDEITVVEQKHPDEFVRKAIQRDRIRGNVVQRNGKEMKAKRLELLKRRIPQLEREQDSKIDALEKVETYLAKYIPVPERKVVERYLHQTPVKGLCMVIEGNECGKLWCYGEKGSLLSQGHRGRNLVL